MENLKTIELKVTVSYKVEDGRIPYEEAEWASAIDLAISPNFHTIENGVSLERVEIEYPDGATKTLQKDILEVSLENFIKAYEAKNGEIDSLSLGTGKKSARDII